MTRDEKQKAIDALKISAPIVCVTKEEFNTYIQTLNKVIDWLEQESILDEIKADIEKLDGMYVLRDRVFYAEKDPKYVGLWYIRLKEVIDIINKYKEEGGNEEPEIKSELEDLSKRVENIENQMKKDKEEQLKKLNAELEYTKFCCSFDGRK